ncbi:MAG: 3,4-dihydroxy-2-butanone-4-phosphate synthase [Candidatus Altiarchaeota archaeon]|nr:3,4-dihydroxy-2-butanone-4-phosphate synthase [Candidatus Altiarchaeota archaeon]
MEIDKAIKDMQRGKFVLIHDSAGRENEIDLAIAAEKVRPADVARMRMDGGGLICLALSAGIANKLKLPFIQDVYKKSGMEIFRALKADDIPYDEKSSFSLSINHRKTFTGITDKDRALTIHKLGRLARHPSPAAFGKNFRTPGHIHTLISSGIEIRHGHTELSTALAEMSGVTPAVAICEMMDARTHRALSLSKAKDYARRNHFALVDTNEILDCWEAHR